MKESQHKSITMSLREKKKTNRFTHTERSIYMKLRIYLPENVGECERELEAFSVRERGKQSVRVRERNRVKRERKSAYNLQVKTVKSENFFFLLNSESEN